MLDFNAPENETAPLNVMLNKLLEGVAPPPERTRTYLGPSAMNECGRKSQLQWLLKSSFPQRILDIFQRGHFAEALTREHLKKIGFKFEWRSDRLEFADLGGIFRGHCDGVILDGPELPEITYPCVWEHKCLNNKGYGSVKRSGLIKSKPEYYAQVQLYQKFLKVTTPAIFTVTNADTMERLHLSVAYDVQAAGFWTKRVEEIIEATRRGELMPRLTTKRDDFRCKMCQFREPCWKRSE